MSLFPSSSPDKIASYITFAGTATADLLKEQLLGKSVPELLLVGVYYAGMLFIIERTNTLEQHRILFDKYGWFSRNERPLMKALTTFATLALPKMLYEWGNGLLDGAQGLNEQAQLMLVTLAIGLVVLEYSKDLVAFLNTKHIEKEWEEGEAATDAFFEHLRPGEFERKAAERLQQGIDELKQLQEQDAQNAQDQRRAEEMQKRTRQIQEQEYRLAILHANVPEAVRLARIIGIPDDKIKKHMAWQHHPDRNGDAATMKQANADLDTWRKREE